MLTYGLLQHIRTHLAEDQADRQKRSILYRAIVRCECVDNCYDLSLFLLIYLLFCLSLCTAPCLALFAFLCACFIAYLCVVLDHIIA